jgi:hypothetical protein
LKGELDDWRRVSKKWTYEWMDLPGISSSLPVLTDTSSFEAGFCVHDVARS